MNNANIAKSIHQRLLNIRDKTGEDFSSILTRYGLERTLYRLMLSKQIDSFVLKGAMLFNIWQNTPGRPTRDIDLLGYGDISKQAIQQVFTITCNTPFPEDGLTFDSKTLEINDIRSDQEYHGLRVRLTCFLANARIPIQIDIGIGDIITPSPEKIKYPTLLNMPAPEILAYNPATVIAEKINAIVTLGHMNSRMKDFYDIYILLNNLELEDTLLTQAIKATFERRMVPLPDEPPVAFTKAFLEDQAKIILWSAFLNRTNLSAFNKSLTEVGFDIKKRIWPLFEKLNKTK